MLLPKSPEKLFINRFDGFAVLSWDKVVKDISDPLALYTTVLAYNVYKTSNPAMRDWVLLKSVTSTDGFGDIDTFYIDFNPGNYIYKVCAVNSIGEGPCIVSFGITATSTIEASPVTALWDEALWDESLYG